MEQWERQFQSMVETDPEFIESLVRGHFVFLRGLDISSVEDVLSGIAGQLRFKYPSAYLSFVRMVEIWNIQMLEEHEKLNHQADVIQFPGKMA
jgi:hypothetical protein